MNAKDREIGQIEGRLEVLSRRIRHLPRESGFAVDLAEEYRQQKARQLELLESESDGDTTT